MIAALLLSILTVTPIPEPPARTVLMPLAEHEAIAGELSRELGLTTVRLKEVKLDLQGCETKLASRSLTPPTVVTVEPPAGPGGWTGLEVLGVSAVVAAVAGAVGFAVGALVAQ